MTPDQRETDKKVEAVRALLNRPGIASCLAEPCKLAPCACATIIVEAALRSSQPVSNADELRPSPSSPEGALELYVIDNWMPAGLPNYVRCKEVEAVLAAARAVFGAQVMWTPELIHLQQALSALDNRRAG